MDMVGLASKDPWKMDDREHNHQPSKRIRFEHSFESRTLSYTFSQGGITDEGRDYGVYTEAPPKLNLKQAEDINSSISTYETHHHHFTQYNGLDHRTTTRPESNMSSSAWALSAAAAGDCNHGLSNGGPADQVCFGMVCLLLLEKASRHSAGRI